MPNNSLNYKEPIELSLKLDAWHELQETKSFYQQAISRSRITFYLFFLLVSGLCCAAWLSLPTYYFIGLCLVIFAFSLIIQVLFLKKAFFWKDKIHYLKRYIKNLTLNTDKKYSPLSLKETTHDPLLTKAVFSRSFKNAFFLISNATLFTIIFYTAYQAW